jgi:excisionase family DNA binding protein
MIVASPVSVDALVGHLERLDAAAVVAMAEQAVEDGRAITDVIATLLLPAWRQLDERATGGEVDRATIGAAATITRRALARASMVAGGPATASDRPPVMVVSSSTSADLLGADVVGELVTAAGWPVDVLSGGPAPEEMAAHFRARRPAALVVTFVETSDLPTAARAIAGAHQEGVPVIVWGPAFGSDGARAARLGADAWAPSLEAVTATIEAWHEAQPVLAPSLEIPPGYLELERDRPALLDATARISGAEGEANEWAQRTAHSVIAHLTAGVLVDDSRILTDHLDAVRRGLARNQLLDVHLLGLVDALAGALSESTEPARSYVLACRDELRRVLVSSRPRSSDTNGHSVLSPTPRPVRSLVVAAPTDGHDSPMEAPAGNAGQVFADILLLAALSCQTPLALVSVPQGQGQWSTLSYGFEQREGLNDPSLFNFVAARVEPVEIADLAGYPGLSACALAVAPHNLRWLYAAPLRNSSGTVLGVVAVLDRWLREISRREQRAMLAVTRQMVAHLSQLRKVQPVQAPAPANGWTPQVSAGRTNGDSTGGLVGLRRAVSLPEGQQLLRSHEVAVLFDVTERTVINWAAAGKLPSLRTIGGHLRFRSEDVLELLAGRSTGQRPAAR